MTAPKTGINWQNAIQAALTLLLTATIAVGTIWYNSNKEKWEANAAAHEAMKEALRKEMLSKEVFQAEKMVMTAELEAAKDRIKTLEWKDRRRNQ